MYAMMIEGSIHFYLRGQRWWKNAERIEEVTHFSEWRGARVHVEGMDAPLMAAYHRDPFWRM